MRWTVAHMPLPRYSYLCTVSRTCGNSPSTHMAVLRVLTLGYSEYSHGVLVPLHLRGYPQYSRWGTRSTNNEVLRVLTLGYSEYSYGGAGTAAPAGVLRGVPCAQRVPHAGTQSTPCEYPECPMQVLRVPKVRGSVSDGMSPGSPGADVGSGERSPGADVGRGEPQQSRCRCGRRHRVRRSRVEHDRVLRDVHADLRSIAVCKPCEYSEYQCGYSEYRK